MDARQPARAILPLPYLNTPKPKPLKMHTSRLARREELAGTGRVPTRGREAEALHLSISGEEGLDFKSEVGVGMRKKKMCTIPIIIQKTVDIVGLTLVEVVVTGAR